MLLACLATIGSLPESALAREFFPAIFPAPGKVDVYSVVAAAAAFACSSSA